MRADDRKEVPIMILLEELRWQKALLGIIDNLAPRLVFQPDRERLWEIREEVLGIIARDLNLKRGVSPSILVRVQGQKSSEPPSEYRATTSEPEIDSQVRKQGSRGSL